MKIKEKNCDICGNPCWKDYCSKCKEMASTRKTTKKYLPDRLESHRKFKNEVDILFNKMIGGGV